MESWPLPMFERLLPRHMQIIYAINAVVLREARAMVAANRGAKEIATWFGWDLTQTQAFVEAERAARKGTAA